MDSVDMVMEREAFAREANAPQESAPMEEEMHEETITLVGCIKTKSGWKKLGIQECGKIVFL